MSEPARRNMPEPLSADNPPTLEAWFDGDLHRLLGAALSQSPSARQFSAAVSREFSGGLTHLKRGISALCLAG